MGMNINSITNQSYMAAASKVSESPQNKVTRVQKEGQALYEELKDSSGTIESGGHIKSIDKERHIIAHIVTNNDPKLQRNHIRVMLYFYKENSDGTIAITGKSSIQYHTANNKKGNYVKAKGPDSISMGSGLSGVDWPPQANEESLKDLSSIINLTNLGGFGKTSVAPKPSGSDEPVGEVETPTDSPAAKGPAGSPQSKDEEKVSPGDWQTATITRAKFAWNKDEGKWTSEPVKKEVMKPAGWTSIEIAGLGGWKHYNPKNPVEHIGDYDRPPGDTAEEIINKHMAYLEKKFGITLNKGNTTCCNYASPFGQEYQNARAGCVCTFEKDEKQYEVKLVAQCLPPFQLLRDKPSTLPPSTVALKRLCVIVQEVSGIDTKGIGQQRKIDLRDYTHSEIDASSEPTPLEETDGAIDKLIDAKADKAFELREANLKKREDALKKQEAELKKSQQTPKK